MKKNNQFAVLSIVLTVPMLLTSCAPGKVTSEQGMKTLEAISEKYESDEIESFDAYTAKMTIEQNKKDDESDLHSLSEQELRIDMKNLRIYSKAFGNEDITQEFWSGFDGKNTYYTIMKSKTVSYYKTKSVSQKEAKELFEAETLDMNASEYLDQSGVSQAMEYAEDYEARDEAYIHTAYGPDVQINRSAEYHSDLQANYQFSCKIAYQGNMKTAIKTGKIDFKEQSKVVINNYHLSHIENKKESIEIIDGKKMISTKYFCIAITNKASIKFPSKKSILK